MSYEFKTLNIADILLDQNNPRFPPVSTQKEAIDAMLKEQGNKLYTLAEDIINHGLDPSKRLILFQDNNKYIDGDGNRRLIVLKILETPELIIGSKHYSTFKNLSNKKKTIEIKEVECVIFPSRDAIKHWLEINHGGYLDGRGQIKWSTEQKERFHGGKSIGLLAKEKLFSEDRITKEEYDSMNLTTLTRLVGSKPGKKALSIKTEDDTVTFNDLDSLEKVYKELKGKSVKEVYHHKDREDFLSESLGTPETKQIKSDDSNTSDDIFNSKNSLKRKTPWMKNENQPIFREKLILKDGLVNNIYLNICDIYELSKKKEQQEDKKDAFVEILGISLRLILDIAAREYYKQNPVEGQNKDAVYKDYLKLIKDQVGYMDKNTISLDANLITEEKVEALLGKLAHGSIRPHMSMILNLSFIIGKILKIHFSKENH